MNESLVLITHDDISLAIPLNTFNIAINNVGVINDVVCYIFPNEYVDILNKDYALFKIINLTPSVIKAPVFSADDLKGNLTYIDIEINGKRSSNIDLIMPIPFVVYCDLNLKIENGLVVSKHIKKPIVVKPMGYCLDSIKKLSLSHQNQPTDNTCMSATLAMALNLPVKQVVEEFHERYIKEGMPYIPEYLESKGLYNIANYQLLDQWVPLDFKPGIYIVSAPSLNIPGSLHSLVIAVLPDDLLTICDPVDGIEGKLFYTLDKEYAKNNPDKCAYLESYIPDLYFPGMVQY